MSGVIFQVSGVMYHILLKHLKKKIHVYVNLPIYRLDFLADQGKARDCSTNNFVINWFIDSLICPLVKLSLRRRHAQMVKNGASSHKTNFIDKIINLEGHLNHCSGSKVTAIILLKGWILPIGGASAGEGLPCSLRSRLVYRVVELVWGLLSMGHTPSSFCPLRIKKDINFKLKFKKYINKS